jgi:hypothetical protein
MNRHHRIIAVLILLLCIALPGCRHRQETGPPTAVSKGSRLDLDQMPDALPPPMPPQVVTNEAELAMEAAADAESRGDIEMALELYDWASMAQVDADQQAEIDYRVARLRADPDSRWFDPQRSQEALQNLVHASPDHPRAPEARIFLALLDRIESSKAATVGLESSLEEARARLAAMKEELEKKDQELKSIKDVLLRKQP